MWAMTSFAILMPAIRPPETIEPGDDRKLQIRTRRAGDLDILRDQYMGDRLGPTIHTPNFDYEYRAYCTHDAFADAMAVMVREIDYEKFKPTTDRYHDHELHSVYNSIWSVVFGRLSTKKHQQEYWASQRVPVRIPVSYFDNAGEIWDGADADEILNEFDRARVAPADKPQTKRQRRLRGGKSLWRKK